MSLCLFRSALQLVVTPARPDVWEKHIAGASQLIRARRVKDFNTEFEKSLLIAMVGPFVRMIVLEIPVNQY